MENRLRFYNTLNRKVETFVPNEEGKVAMYTCGPTVYHFAHIGNLRSYIEEDVLEKALRYVGYDVKRVMNITDVGHLSSDADTGEDKMLKGAKREHKTVMEIAGMENSDEAMAVAEKSARTLGMSPYYLYRQKNMTGNLENVGFAAPGKEGIYNILIMEEKQTIAACGAGSISKRVDANGRIERRENVKDVTQYIERIKEMLERKKKLFCC